MAVVAGCASGDDVPMGESGGEQTSSDGGDAPDDAGCPSDVDLNSTAPKSVAAESLDEDTLDGDPRFVAAFCASYCPLAPEGYERLFCEPVDDSDVLPPAGSADTTDSGTSTDTTGGSETGDSTSEISGSSSSSSSGGDDELIELRCYYWPGCL